jgi:hypothetical protein
VHNTVFALRSIVTTILASLSVYHGHTKLTRQIAVIGSSATALLTMLIADEATKRLQVNTKTSQQP